MCFSLRSLTALMAPSLAFDSAVMALILASDIVLMPSTLASDLDSEKESPWKEVSISEVISDSLS